MSDPVERPDGGFDYPLAGMRVVALDHHRMTLSEGEILGPPEDRRDLLGCLVCSASSSPEGRLDLVFADGRELGIDPDERYEAWEIRIRKEMTVICLPGGGVDWLDHDQPPLTSDDPAARERIQHMIEAFGMPPLRGLDPATRRDDADHDGE